MKDQQLAKLTADLRKLRKVIKAIPAHLAKFPRPNLSPWDKRRPLVIVTGGPNYSLL